MTGKYADRFRPPSSAQDRDVLDLGEIDTRSDRFLDDRDEVEGLEQVPRRRWHESWATRIALLVTLLVGAAGGAIGWERWQVHEAEVASRSSVELVASAVTLNYAAEDEIAIALTYRNEGEHEVILRDVRFDSDRLVPLSDPDVLEIAPGDSETHVFTVRAQCPNGVDDVVGPPDLVVTVETVDGIVGNRVINSDLVGAEVVDWFGYACQVDYSPTFAESFAEVIAVTPGENGTVVRALIFFSVGESGEVAISNVEAGSPAFTVIYTVGDMTSSTSFEAPPITVVYRVGDCDRARQASDQDMSVTITGAYEGTAPGELLVYPSATLAAELVRLTERSCPA